MPIARYNAAFTGKPRAHPGAAGKVRQRLIKQYGSKRGERIFYAMVNRRRNMGRRVPRPGAS